MTRDKAARPWEPVLTEVNARLGSRYDWHGLLRGGEQGGAHLVVEDTRSAVLKWQPPGEKAEQLLRALPLVVRATHDGWPAARWLEAGLLDDGGAFLLQEHVEGVPMSSFGVPEVRAVLAANGRQRGLASADASDDSARLDAVLSGDCAWKRHVAGFTAAGAELVSHGDRVAAWAGWARIPDADLVHGDCSSTNILLDATRSAATFVDCQGVARGSRVRDLADLYRQSFVYPSSDDRGLPLLRAAAVAVEGPEVFARCAVAVSYANLAWWVEHKTPAEFDQACTRLHRLFDDLRVSTRRHSEPMAEPYRFRYG